MKGSRLTDFAIRHPGSVVALAVALTLILTVLALLPSVWPGAFPRLHGVEVDTDPENMLSEDEAVRVFHDRMRRVLTLYDMVVLGVVNEHHPEGVFNPDSLRRIFELTRYAEGLRGDAIGVDDPQAGVVEVDVIAPSTVDNIEQAGPGLVRFEWLMPEPPASEEEALEVRRKAQRIPFLDGTLVSEDGLALCVYLPLTSKDLSYRVYSRLRERIAALEGEEEYHITGLPVAEDTFGVEMFVQMAVSAPLAMLVIFLLMLFFFRKLTLIVSPLLVALMTVMCTMGLLVVTGNTIHIMSSMIPIFIMPIAVLDSVHILSEFFDRYQASRDRKATLGEVIDTLFSPMLFTSLTSAAGFGSLALTPIPPVQVFGVFVALGILLAWLFTVTFIPAYITMMSERSLAGFGLHHGKEAEGAAKGLLSRTLVWLGGATYRRARVVLAMALVAAVVAAWGITRIQINDNPTKWFRASHPIRVADRVLNEHFGGTYMAYLSLLPEDETLPVPEDAAAKEAKSPPAPAEAPAASPPPGLEAGRPGGTDPELPAGLGGDPEPSLPVGASDTAPSGLPEPPALPVGLGGVEDQVPPPRAAEEGMGVPLEIFKQPEALRYIEGLQAHLQSTGVVGKSNSLADIVKTVHRELKDGSESAFRIPDSAAGVAQTLVQYQSSHRPGDVWHFVTPDSRVSSIWVQLKSGDNKDMEKVVAAVDAYTASNPPPFDLEPRWFGLTYINVIWQEKMVFGMLKAFLSSFVVVLVMMTILFRSPAWGLLSMIPLTLTIGLIYGVIGIVGKDYDMPVAVLSALTLGLAVDFAIHFLARSRVLYEEHGSWKRTLTPLFGEPARAISRNVIVIALGFTPLLAAPLVPYNTVGIFLASILVASGLATMVLLPAFLGLLEPRFFGRSRRRGGQKER